MNRWAAIPSGKKTGGEKIEMNLLTEAPVENNGKEGKQNAIINKLNLKGFEKGNRENNNERIVADSYYDADSKITQVEKAAKAISAGNRPVRHFNLIFNDGLVKEVNNHISETGESSETERDFMEKVRNSLITMDIGAERECVELLRKIVGTPDFRYLLLCLKKNKEPCCHEEIYSKP